MEFWTDPADCKHLFLVVLSLLFINLYSTHNIFQGNIRHRLLTYILRTDAIITKLLTKRRGSKHPLSDRIRFRIVTATVDEIVPVVAYLGRHLFPFHLIVPGESHNSIFNFKDFIRRHPRISKMIPELQVNLMPKDETIEPSNPDTSSKFKTVKFIVDLPIRLDERHMEVWAPGIKLSSRVVHVLSEFQIVDQASNIENTNGDARHDRYKARRMTKAKERLLYGRTIRSEQDNM